jgi:pyrroloquinoline quinone biosynthesis protein B
VCTGSDNSFLINASPDLRTQILSAPLLSPTKSPRHTPIVGALLTNADVDAVAGLLHLRESQPLHIYATPSVRRIAQEENSMFRVLNRANPPAVWEDLQLNVWFPLDSARSSGAKPSIRCRAIPLGHAFPDYVSDALRRSLSPSEAVVGLVLEEEGKRVFYAPSLPGASEEWKEWAQSSDVCLIDGTFWTNDELIAAGVGTKTARAIGHVPLSGPGGLLEKFPSSPGRRKILIHINNTNPILDEDSPEHREVRDAGWEIAYDGMQIDL